MAKKIQSKNALAFIFATVVLDTIGIGIIFPIELFPTFVSKSLLLLSFIAATLIPLITWNIRNN